MHHSGALSMKAIRLYRLVLTILMVLTLAGCAASDTGAPSARLGSKIQVCKGGDVTVDSSRQCLQDDAACYQLANGKWCTGERGNVCPAGSIKIPQGSACPPGARCIKYGESLNCAIQTR